MITADHRCTRKGCPTDIYRMVGHCTNCGTVDILILYTSRHEAVKVDCPVCGCFWTVTPTRLATADEIPSS